MGLSDPPQTEPPEYDDYADGAFNPEPIDPDSIIEDDLRIATAAQLIPNFLTREQNISRVVNQGDKRRQICREALMLADELISLVRESN